MLFLRGHRVAGWLGQAPIIERSLSGILDSGTPLPLNPDKRRKATACQGQAPPDRPP